MHDCQAAPLGYCPGLGRVASVINALGGPMHDCRAAPLRAALGQVALVLNSRNLELMEIKSTAYESSF
jgi:hypothetical protein